MLVIEGNCRKDKELSRILKKKGASQTNSLILGTNSTKSLFDYGKSHYRVPSILELVKFLYYYSKNLDPLAVKVDRKKLKYIVLETDSSPDMITTFRQFEKLLGKELIVTIQSSDSKTRVYEI